MLGLRGAGDDRWLGGFSLGSSLRFRLSCEEGRKLGEVLCDVLSLKLGKAEGPFVGWSFARRLGSTLCRKLGPKVRESLGIPLASRLGFTILRKLGP